MIKQQQLGAGTKRACVRHHEGVHDSPHLQSYIVIM